MGYRDRLVWFGLLSALGLGGCGLLSNDLFFDGVGRVSGRIVLGGQPVEGAVVFVPDERDGVFERVASDAEGRFEVRVWAGRGRRLLVLWGSSLGLGRDFDLASEGHLDLGELELEAMGELRGRVSLADGDAHEAEVEVIGSALVARPDALGRFSIQLPPGLWNLEYSAIGYLRERREGLRVEAGEGRDMEPVILAAEAGHSCLGSELRSERFSQGGGGQVDLLFVIDNSGSMAGEQFRLAQSFAGFVAELKDGGVDFQLGVVTTGMASQACPACSEQVTASCFNESGETGILQQNRGHFDDPAAENPLYTFENDASCRLMGPDNLDCFYEAASASGVALVGLSGCGYERGLAAMRAALDPDGPQAAANAGFVRPDARLGVVVVSDEEDCGEVGDVSERLVAGGKVCYYAARGEGPANTFFHPDDPSSKPYALTPVEDYAEFLRGLKDKVGLVSFSAIVGVSDAEDPGATRIEYADDADPDSEILPVCSQAGCAGSTCGALPGTRYVELAQATGGMIDSICAPDFSESLSRLVRTSTGYFSSFPLSREPSSTDAIVVEVNGEPRTRWSYDAEARAIVFAPDARPQAYDAVTITYVALCP